MSRFSRIFGRVLGFGLSTIVSGVATFLTVPVLISAVGPLAWSGVAVGQSVGIVGGVIVGFGWAVSGSSSVAMLDRAGADDYFRRSLAIRGLLAIPVAVVAALAAGLVAPAAALPAALAAAAGSIGGLTGSWYFVGLSAPTRYLMLETVPKAVGGLGGALAVLFGAPLFVFPLGLLLGIVVSVAVTMVSLTTRRWFVRDDVRGIRATLMLQRHAALTAAVSTTYLNLPTVAVAIFWPAQTPIFALADRVFKLANAAVTPLTQVAQGWIPHPDLRTRLQRIKTGLRAVSGIAGGVAIGFVALSIPVSVLLSAGKLSTDLIFATSFGATLLFTTISQTVGIACLMSLGAGRAVALSAVLGAALGVPVLVVGTILFGAHGAAVAEAVAEAAVVIYQLVVLRRVYRASARSLEE
ncbi:MAG: hypothetical protein JWO10_1453 [Microbacteriaceae bacterium]|nr:hypothetical protein [Microbacteriaceae bacterium]